MSTSKDLSLKSLEVFQACARHGTLRSVSQALGISTSTAAHHLRRVEDHLCLALLDHDRKPMVLTPAGQSFLREIEPALAALRQAEANAKTNVARAAGQLRFGTIEDFESEIVPDLAVFLTKILPNFEFSYHIDPSLSILEMLQDRALDIAIVASPSVVLTNVNYSPILRDPFVLLVPEDCPHSPEELIFDNVDFPFLRFNKSQMIAQQIEAQLQRMQLVLPERLHLGNNETLMAMVAAGAGWAITTPLLYARGERFHKHVRMHRFPEKQFSREIALAWTADCPEHIRQMVAEELYKLIEIHAITSVHSSHPWLKDSFVSLQISDQ